jgi:hypothetical protein
LEAFADPNGSQFHKNAASKAEKLVPGVATSQHLARQGRWQWQQAFVVLAEIILE